MQLPEKLTASGNVLVLLSLMYFITYVDSSEHFDGSTGNQG
jgi:hypothetical protein